MKDSSIGLKKFIKINTDKWNNSPSITKKDDVVLIEGRPFPNQIISTSIIAKIMERDKKCIPLVLSSNKITYNEHKSVYNSFGISNFYLLNKNIFINISIFIKVVKTFLYSILLLLYHKIDFDWFINNFKIKNINFGENIYDLYIRYDKTFLSVDKHIFKLLKIIFQTIYKYYVLDDIFKQHKVKYVIIVTNVYTTNGSLLYKIALSRGIKVILPLGLHYPQLFLERPNLWYEYKKVSKKDIENFNFSDKHLKSMDTFLENRFHGKVESQNFNFDYAYKNKTMWSKSDLKEYYGDSFNVNNPVVFIFAHAFSDANHAYGNLIFQSLYSWLIETIKIIENIKSVNWIIKPHPSSSIYEEDGITESIINNNTSTHIFLSPDNINNLSVFNLSTTVVTIRGSIGMESSCRGMRPIISGEAYYSDYEFVIKCKDKEEYKNQLSNIHKIQKLNDKEILLAKKVMHMYMLGRVLGSDILVDDSILTPGENLSNDKKMDEIYNKVVDNVLKYGYENDSLYEYVENNIIPKL